MTLIASWSFDQDMSTENPKTVRWIDGRASTTTVYRQHMLDTHTVLIGQFDQIEMHIFPNIVAAVKFDREKGHWVASGRGVIPTALDLTDSEATNDQIVAELYTYPIVYRAEIIR